MLAVPAFLYAVSADPQGYSMRIEMVFSKGVGLSRVVSDFKDDHLIHDLYANADPGETELEPGSAGEIRYKKTLSIRNYGMRTRMLSHCSESSPKDAQHWVRHCELDLTVLDGGKRMTGKSETATCDQLRADQPVRCVLEVKGGIKPFWIVSSAVLTIKAKAQALINWGRFWFYAQNGSVSAKASNELFDRSELSREIEDFTQKGLEAAKRSGPFRFASQGHFDGLDSRSAGLAGH